MYMCHCVKQSGPGRMYPGVCQTKWARQNMYMYVYTKQNEPSKTCTGVCQTK